MELYKVDMQEEFFAAKQEYDICVASVAWNLEHGTTKYALTCAYGALKAAKQMAWYSEHGDQAVLDAGELIVKVNVLNGGK